MWPAVAAAAFLIAAAVVALAAYLADDLLGMGLAGVLGMVGIGWGVLAGQAANS